MCICILISRDMDIERWTTGGERPKLGHGVWNTYGSSYGILF